MMINGITFNAVTLESQVDFDPRSFDLASLQRATVRGTFTNFLETISGANEDESGIYYAGVDGCPGFLTGPAVRTDDTYLAGVMKRTLAIFKRQGEREYYMEHSFHVVDGQQRFVGYTIAHEPMWNEYFASPRP